MRIQEVLLEFELPSALRNTPIADVFGTTITAGQITDVVPGVDPKDVIKYGSKINNFLQTQVADGISVGDALLGVATILPIARAGRLAMAGRRTAAAGQVAKSQVISQAGKQIGKNVSLMPDAPTDGAMPTAQPAPPVVKKRRKVGEVIPVKHTSGKFNLPIVKVLPDNGYVVDASKIPGQQKGATLSAPEPDELSK